MTSKTSVVLLAGGNPQIAKGEGDAVKWNSPFYGIEAHGWLLSFHCHTRYIKVAFFRGTSLRPMPPVESKQKDVRYVHIHEEDMLGDGMLDDDRFIAWVKQASRLPGERM